MRDHTRTRAAGLAAALAAGVLLVACSADEQTVPLEVRIVQDTPAKSLTRMTMTVWGGDLTYYAHPEILLTEADLTVAKPIQVDGAAAIELVLSDEARERLADATRSNVGSRLGIILNGKLQCASVIDAPIETGTVLVTGHMLEPTAKRYSRALTRGAVSQSNPIVPDEM